MPLADYLADLFRSEAQHLQRVVLAPDHVDVLAQAAPEPIRAGQSYFRLWATQMFLKNDTNWFKSWYPAVQSLVGFQFGDLPRLEVANVAGPSHLRSIDQDNLDQVVQLDFPLTPLIPYNGGTVDVQVGLLAMIASNDLRRFLNVMGNFAGLLAVPQLSQTVAIAGKVSDGVEQLFGVGKDHMVLGYRQTFTGAESGGANVLREHYIAIINAPHETYPAAQLWVREGMVLFGPDAARARPLTGVDYMLLRLETTRDRNEWEGLASISGPYKEAVKALGQFDPTGKWIAADALIQKAILEAFLSPDLTVADRSRVSNLIRNRYVQAKRALVGDLGGGSTHGATRGGVAAPPAPAALPPALDEAVQAPGSSAPSARSLTELLTLN